MRTPEPFFSLRDLFPDPREQVSHDERGAAGDQQKEIPRCDFSPGKRSIISLDKETSAVSLWKRSVYGLSLEEIKSKPGMTDFFAENISRFISSVMGWKLSDDEFIIVSPPKRRHPGKENFASRMNLEIANKLGLVYLDDFVVCRTRQRIDPDFTINKPLPVQKNIIVVDDIITTGSTLQAMKDIIKESGKNALFFAGIHNKF